MMCLLNEMVSIIRREKKRRKWIGNEMDSSRMVSFGKGRKRREEFV